MLTPARRQELSEIYERAALIFQDDEARTGCCKAISNAVEYDGREDDAIEIFEEMFMPENNPVGCAYWMGQLHPHICAADKTQASSRMNALLFASHAILDW